METQTSFDDILKENVKLRRELIRIKSLLHKTWLKNYDGDEQELIDDKWEVFEQENELNKEI